MNTGYQTLETIAGADHFNRWMYDTIAPFLKGKILEIGSGIGNISKYALQAGHHITLSDINNQYINKLNAVFGLYENVDGILNINLSDEDFNEKYSSLYQKFDTVFLLNVLEHIAEDDIALQHCNLLLKSGGTIVVLVPAYQFLFSRMDLELEHYTRYDGPSLKDVLTRSNFEVKQSFYFNSLGIAGWWLNKVLQNKEISRGKMTTFNTLVPIAKILDKVFCNKIGLSVIAVGVKK